MGVKCRQRLRRGNIYSRKAELGAYVGVSANRDADADVGIWRRI